jgi:Pro-kumamolisin, activation domain/Bacterial Ig-like domain (group 3)/Abnormal spindle-like microcephaly-assoc'd, ASPM-SPD-2-Hydin
MIPRFFQAEAMLPASYRLCFSLRRAILLSAFSLMISLPAPAQVLGPVASRVVTAVDETRLVRLRGNTHPMARTQFDKGLVDPDKRMERIVLVLQRSAEQEKSLSDFNQRQQDPTSPDYHHWLHADEFGQLYGPSDYDVAAVTTWLKNHGFRIDEVSKGRVSVQFSGTASQVQQAFHVEMHHYLVNGEDHIANDRDPQIPEALSPVVDGLASLHDFFSQPQSVFGKYVRKDRNTGKVTPVEPEAVNQAQPQLTYVASNGATREDLTPYDIATIYNILPLWNASTPINGTGVKIAISGQSDIQQIDIDTFRSSFGLPASTVTTIFNGADPGIIRSSQGENTLDVEMAGATAPRAQIILVTSASTSTTSAAQLSDQYIVDNEVAPIMSASYGECEAFLGTSGNAAFNAIWQQGATEGISIFESSGDQGSAGCSNSDAAGPYTDQQGLQVNGDASSPYVTAVGGTDFTWSFLSQPTSTYWNTANSTTLATAKGYLPEVPWNSTCTNPLVYPLFGTEFTNAAQLCNAAVGSSTYEALVAVAGSSGGVSHCTTSSGPVASCAGGYPKPSWQTGPGVPADGLRDLPDVSLFASSGFSSGINGSALLFCETQASPDVSCDYTHPNFIVYQETGGTSASSPMMAGIMALVVQKTGVSQGLANPVLYQLAQAQATLGTACDSSTVASGNSCVFYDISQGTNAQVCHPGGPNCVTNTSGDTVGILSGYAATKGYDQAVGLGSVNVTNLVNAWPTTTVSYSPTSYVFPATTVSTTSPTTGVVTVKNTGTSPESFSTISFAGTNASSFSDTTNCPLGATLAAGASCTVTMSFQPTTTGTLTATLNIVDGFGTQSVTVSGSGSAAAAPTVSVSPTILTFASTTVGTTTAAQAVTVTNTGTSALTLGAIGLSGANANSFQISANTCGSSLASSVSCMVSIAFDPTASGPLTASLSFADNATGSPQTVTLAGTAVAAAITATLTPPSLVFTSTTVGSTSAAQTATLTNTGTTSLAITGVTLGGTNAASFSDTTTCGTTLAGGASCTVSVSFKPATTGTLTATLNVADNATGSPQMMTMTGTGATAPLTATLAPATLSFASTTTGSTSAAQTATLTNTGTTSLAITGVTLSGTNATSFSDTTTCGTALAATASCTVSVSFSPTTAGTLTAILNISDNAAGSPQTVALSGTGTAPALTPTTTTLTSSVISTVTGASVNLTATVTPAGVPLTGIVTFYNGTTSLGTGTLSSGGVATLATSFSAAGTFNITATYGGSSAAAASTSSVLTLNVVTTGVFVSISPANLTITRGNSGMLTLTIAPAGGYTGTVAFSCGSLPQNLTCTFAPSSITLTSTSTATTDTLTINTMAASSAMSPLQSFGGSAGILAAATLWAPGSLAALFAFGRRKRLSVSAQRLWMMAMLCLGLGSAAMLGGCGSSPKSTTTAAGSYTIPITLSLSGGSVQTVNAAVTVQ